MSTLTVKLMGTQVMLYRASYKLCDGALLGLGCSSTFCNVLATAEHCTKIVGASPTIPLVFIFGHENSDRQWPLVRCNARKKLAFINSSRTQRADILIHAALRIQHHSAEASIKLWRLTVSSVQLFKQRDVILLQDSML